MMRITLTLESDHKEGEMFREKTRLFAGEVPNWCDDSVFKTLQKNLEYELSCDRPGPAQESEEAQ